MTLIKADKEKWITVCINEKTGGSTFGALIVKDKWKPLLKVKTDGLPYFRDHNEFIEIGGFTVNSQNVLTACYSRLIDFEVLNKSLAVRIGLVRRREVRGVESAVSPVETPVVESVVVPSAQFEDDPFAEELPLDSLNIIKSGFTKMAQVADYLDCSVPTAKKWCENFGIKKINGVYKKAEQ